jgi:exopolyphosphatase/guanosine-5'-triphosphate,3'-diphosphate pyrophosphatase
MRVGAIDIGSNSVRLLVAEVPDGGTGTLTPIARAGEACRLGRGLDRTGRIEAEIGERAAALTQEFVRRARSLGARRIVIGATAALRRAENGIEIAGVIERRSGLPIRILSGEDEARLVYEAVISGLGTPARRRAGVVFDLGGGSTEVVSGVGLQPGRWKSLPFGAVTLTEKFLAGTPPTPEQIDLLVAFVDENLMQQCAYMPAETPLLAGVGGTVTVLAALDRGIEVYEPSLLDGWLIPAERLELLIERVAGSTERERSEWTVLGHGRSDIVAAGALVVRSLVRRFRSPGLTCSTQGLRYGLARLAAAEGVEIRPVPPREDPTDA